MPKIAQVLQHLYLNITTQPEKRKERNKLDISYIIKSVGSCTEVNSLTWKKFEKYTHHDIHVVHCEKYISRAEQEEITMYTLYQSYAII